MKYVHYEDKTPVNLEQVIAFSENTFDGRPSIIFYVTDGGSTIRWTFVKEDERNYVYQRVLIISASNGIPAFVKS